MGDVKIVSFITYVVLTGTPLPLVVRARILVSSSGQSVEAVFSCENSKIVTQMMVFAIMNSTELPELPYYWREFAKLLQFASRWLEYY